MSKTVVIHQPDFLPYLGFFQRFLHSDLWVILDNVQFARGSKRWHNRDKIKTPKGEQWITIAVQNHSQDIKISDVLLSKEVDWRTDNINQIKENYRSAPHFKEIFPYIEQLYGFQSERLIDFNLKSIEMLQELFNIQIESIFASTLNPVGSKNELLVDILTKVKATKYLSGLGAKNYFDPEPFRSQKIEVIWQNFQHPLYPQLHGPFKPYLSSIDLLLNCGIEKSREMLRSC